MTGHLTRKEIKDFLAIRILDDASLKLSLRVNSHMMNCKKCRELVRAYEIIGDEFAEESVSRAEVSSTPALVMEIEREV